MFEQSSVSTRLPAQDLERARTFYSEKPGLDPIEPSVSLAFFTLATSPNSGRSCWSSGMALCARQTIRQAHSADDRRAFRSPRAFLRARDAARHRVLGSPPERQ